MQQKKSGVEVIRTDADGIANNNEDGALVVLEISRREIESGNVASALERLLVLSDSRESAYRYREALMFMVTGYDADRRELPEIPEVRAFFARLTDEWPHWMWYMVRGMGAIPLLLALLCQVNIHRAKDGAVGTEFIDETELYKRISGLFERGGALIKAFGITAEEAETSAESALAELVA